MTAALYTPRTPPREHQREILALSHNMDVFAFDMEPGTGKSWLVIQTLAHWFEHRHLRAALIVAPNGVHENWVEQFSEHMDAALPLRLLSYVSTKRDKQWQEVVAWNKELDTLRTAGAATGPLWVVTMNVEALSHKSGSEFAEGFLALSRRRKSKVAVIVDEYHKVKKPSAKRTRTILRLAKGTDLRRILSGTPTPKGLEDLYAPYALLDPSIIGCRTVAEFRREFCIEQRFDRFTKIVGYRNVNRLRAAIAPYRVVKTLDECMDLPPIQGGILNPAGPLRIEVEMGEEQARYYRQMEQVYVTALSSGEVVTATEAATRLLRLQQITGGAVKNDQGELEYFPSAKVAAVVDIAENARNTKLLVWCRFIHEVHLVVAGLRAAGLTALAHTGEETATIRKGIREHWKDPDGPQTLVSTQASGGTGYTLNEAAVSVFYSNWWAFDDRLQTERRNLRIGQGKPIVYYDIVVRRSVDGYILKNLLGKRDISRLISGDPLGTLRAALAA